MQPGPYIVLIILLNQSMQAQTGSLELFQPGIINTGHYESHPAFSPDGNTLYFLKCTPDINNFCAICISTRRNDKWSQPVVAPFSGLYYDIDPFVSPDGKYLYFCSNRPVRSGDATKDDTDIWRVAITTSGWEEPERLSTPVNSAFDEYYPTLSGSNTLYFGSNRNGKDSNIYKSVWSNGYFTNPEILGDSINTSDNEYEPFIAPDESYIIFMATIPKGLVNADLYISYNRDGKWTKAQRLSYPVNSLFTEWSPKVTFDKKYFFFSSTRSISISEERSDNLNALHHKLENVGNGLGDIYFMDASFLKLKK